MPTPKVIVSDLDGTLFGPDHRLAQTTIDTLRAARTAGLKVVAATGRHSLSAMERLAEHDVLDALVCSNGALIHDVDTDTTTHRFAIEPDHLGALFGALDAGISDLSYCWELENSYGWDHDFETVARQHPDLSTFDIATRPTAEHLVTKVMVAHPTLAQEVLAERVRPHLPAPLSVACSGVQFVEITGVGVNKAVAVEHVIARWGMTASDVVAFGDNQNDVDMLRWAGTGLAMSNAVQSAKLAADHVIGHHGDHAVARYLDVLLATLR